MESWWYQQVSWAQETCWLVTVWAWPRPEDPMGLNWESSGLDTEPICKQVWARESSKDQSQNDPDPDQRTLWLPYPGPRQAARVEFALSIFLPHVGSDFTNSLNVPSGPVLFAWWKQKNQIVLPARISDFQSRNSMIWLLQSLSWRGGGIREFSNSLLVDVWFEVKVS